MRTQIIRIAFTAALALATASTFSSCSSDDEKVYPYMCGGMKYEVGIQVCENDVIINLEECGDELYNPTWSFCNEGNRYELCNGLVYDPMTQDCDRRGDNDIVIDLCGGFGYDYSYNPATQFCYKHDYGNNYYEYEIADKCNGAEYNLETHFCYENGLLETCGGYYKESYDPATQFCYYGRWYWHINSDYSDYSVEYKCGGEEYNLETHFCYENELVDLCKSSEEEFGHIYDISREFCSNSGYVTYKCNGKEYNTETYFCHENEIMEKCGLSPYDPATYFCYNGSSWTKCGGEIYDPETQRCSDNVI